MMRCLSPPPTQICGQMEQLELENRQLKDSTVKPEGAQFGSVVDGELLRLQAENTALQRNVAGSYRPPPNLKFWPPCSLRRC